MSLISISNLQPTGSDLFAGEDNFMSEISENELDSITGGFIMQDTVIVRTGFIMRDTIIVNPKTGGFAADNPHYLK